MVKWYQILWQQLVRDVLMPGFGAWVVYKQVYAADPSGYLLAFAGGCFWPAARSAVTTILSGPGSSSEPREPPGELPPPSLPPGGVTGERG